MRINFVTLACRAHYGAVLTWQGRWPEAEGSLTEATGQLAAERPSWSGLAIVGSPICAGARGASQRRRSSSNEPRAMRSPRW